MIFSGAESKTTQVKKSPEISDFLQGIPPCFRQVSRLYYVLKRETRKSLNLIS